MRKYRPSNRTPFASFFLLLLLGVVAALIIGLALFAVDYYLHFYLVLLFPIIGGAIVGGVLAFGARAGKVRSPIVAGFVGVLAGLLMYATYQYASYYIGFRSDMRAAYIENVGSEPTDAELNRSLDKILHSEVGDTGFAGYLRLVADSGFSITRTGYSSSGSEVELQGTTVWGYWAVEILIAVGFAAVIAARQAGQPFDEEADAWYGKPELLAVASTKSRKALLTALKDGEFQRAGSLLTTEPIKYPRTELYVRRTPATNPMLQDIFVTVSHAQRNKRVNPVRSGVVSPSEFDLINRGIQRGTAASRESFDF